MSNEPQLTIAFAMPKLEFDRERLRRQLPGVPLVAIYKDGVDKPCARCAMTLNVGPRVAATGIAVYCPWCVMKVMQQEHIEIADTLSLGKPDSKFENEE